MIESWLEREALVTVKAYPNPSPKYRETVCVAAVTREEGWVRLYPVGFRSLPEGQRFKKYQRIRLRMRKHDRDNRPESYRPDEHSIRLGDVVGSGHEWQQRWQWIKPTIGPTMCELQRLQKSESRSLGCVRARDVDNLLVEKTDDTWQGRRQAAINQLALFDPVETKLEKIPFIFRYRYRCDDRQCRGHTQSVLDWELMERYRKLSMQGLSETEVLSGIREKFLGELCNKTKDTHFFVGNHSRFPVTFMVLGVFWPPKSAARSLF
jgi:hypothetical protein